MRRRLIGGGGGRVNEFSVSTLATSRLVAGCADDLCRLDTLVYFNSEELAPACQTAANCKDIFVFDLPLEVLAEGASYAKLRSLALAHRIGMSRGMRSLRSLMQSLQTHQCNVSCPHLYAEFSPSGTDANRVTAAYAVITVSVLSRYNIVRCSGAESKDSDVVRFCALVSHVHTWESSYDFIVDIPLRELPRVIPCEVVSSLCALHGIVVPRGSVDVPAVCQLLGVHRCGVACSRVYAAYSLAVIETPVATFPPRPVEKQRMVEMAQEFAVAMSASSVAEGPCAVCGRLKFYTEMTTYEMDKMNLAVLARGHEGVAVRERRDPGVSVDVVSGPILCEAGTFVSDGCRYMYICKPCLGGIQTRRLPRHALANGLWIGDRPDVLARLGFLEKLLIAKYWHNICVVQLSQGQRKMRANVIVYPQPVIKMFTMLPPPRKQMDLCLAILFAGPVHPSEFDYRRAPLLIRHEYVYEALTWLCCNHKDYRDVEISADNLAQYPEGEPPVKVVYCEGSGDPSAQSLAVYDTGTEKGTDDGECSFAVYGLTGTEVAKMSYEAKVLLAVEWLRSGGRMLSITHDSQPASIYNNPDLYPGMFPWLFPYGLGGIDNSLISTQLGRARQVRHLLLYYDRRFQVDEYFPFVAFNHQQLMASSSAGVVLAKKPYFDDVVDMIMSLNPDVLSMLSEKNKRGEFLRPETAEERRCFDILKHIEFVSGRVQGSLTGRKYMRNELKSLTIDIGVPIYFVTFALPEFNNRLCLYFCGYPIDILANSTVLPDYNVRLRSVNSNPVASARFFDHMVNCFLQYIVRVGDSRGGVFGQVSHYYGTVEAQAREALHLHIVLWVVDALSPQEM